MELLTLGTINNTLLLTLALEMIKNYENVS